MSPPFREIRALYDDETITVYQAYNRTIAAAAVAKQKLDASPQFRTTRMTWIKPSWAWMLYRAGYSYKDPGQERILALKMRHADFLGLLEQAVLSHGPDRRARRDEEAEPLPDEDHDVPTSGEQDPADISSGASSGGSRQGKVGTKRAKLPGVRIQWDPERTVRLGKLEYRSIQIGIPGSVSPEWVASGIVGIEDVTERARDLKKTLDENPDVDVEELRGMGLVPVERPFQIPEALHRSLRMVRDGD